MSQQTKKKKQPKNAFYFFMVEYKNKQENRGVRFPEGMKDVAQKAHPVWQTMGPQDRWKYEEEARREKERDKTNLDNKFTTFGKSYAEVNRENYELKVQTERMMHEIQNTISSLDPSSSLSTYPFHTIHVNYYCRQINGVYTPCEISLAEFNFSEGVRRTYHTLINPGQIPLGYKFEADTLSAETHKIPAPPEEFGGETDYYKIFTKVKRFVMGMNDKELYPYYTHPNSIDAVKSVLLKLQDDFSEKIEFRIYPLTHLFYNLRNACVTVPGGQGFPAFSLAERELERDVFNFARGISCEFHEETDALPYCSLSCVKRWCFLIMDHCCRDLGIELIPGQHCPRQSDTARYLKMTSRPPSVAEHSRPSSVAEHSRPSSVAEHSRPSSVAEHATSSKTNYIPHSTSKLGSVMMGTKSMAAVTAGTSKESEQLTPLRLPRTMSEAIKVMDQTGKFSEEDFPAIGQSRRGQLGSEPIAVAGRGKMIQSKLTNPITIGRGHSLNLDKLNIE